jgi:hypothetical protein
MASQADIAEPQPPWSGRRIALWAALGVLAVIVAGLAIAWFSRERIADDIIADQLADLGLEATYTIESIGPGRQVVTDIVVGDTDHPDLTVERAEVTLRYRFGFPRIGAVKLVRPKLYGTYVGGKLSFGALDPLVFREPEGPFEFPDLSLEIVEGRGLLETDGGPVGFSAKGKGYLRDGFAGELAATAPRLTLAGCDATRATLYGKVSIESQKPAFAGPVRLARLACSDLELADAALQVSGSADRTLNVFEAETGLRAGPSRYAGNRLASLTGTSRFTWRDSGLTARYDLTGTGLATAQAAASRIGFEGWLRTRRNFDRIELEADVEGAGVRLGSGLDAALADAAEAGGDTLLGPILDRVRTRLAAEGRASRLTGEVSLRRTGARTSIVVPEASLRGGSGATLLALSRFQVVSGGSAAPRFAGNFSTGGEGLPRIVGRMEQRPGGSVQVRMSMAEYAAGASRLAVPNLVLVQRPNGMLGFSGRVLATGALPGGQAENLLLPVVGNWSSGRGLALWSDCTELRFERLQLANLSLARQRLTLCPPRGSAIVRYDGRGLRIAAGAPALQLSGSLGQTPIAIRSGAVGFAYPGSLSARQLLVTLGPRDTATTFAVNDLSAQIGSEIAGKFAGTDVRLFAVPLDLNGASGDWRYAGGKLTLSNGSFRLEDRRAPELHRFNPLTAQGATLTLADNLIRAEALLRDAGTARTVAQVDLAHNLANGVGHADLVVPGLTFDAGFQPADRGCADLLAGRSTTLPLGLSCQAFGVVNDVRGTITGTGRIDWNQVGVTSSGQFSTDSLDFAAAFGPVKGASGTIVFSDLLGMTTAPNQRLRVASINPGIEVTNGEIGIELRDGQVLALTSGSWPFMGGTLTMHPVEIRFGTKEVRRYVLEVEGLDAAQFVDYMELNNISATGIFDGTVSLVFDENGFGRVEEGLLLSRPPGGNVSYVGELTYEDLGTIPNLAFQALRSLDYRQMSVTIEGPLTGEIVTRVRLDSVSQGAGAERNILTRAIAGLPIRLDVNVRASFYSLISNLRSMYDPSAVRDPRDLGLIDAQGNVIRRETNGPPPEPVTPEDLIPDEAAIQRRESEESP